MIAFSHKQDYYHIVIYERITKMLNRLVSAREWAKTKDSNYWLEVAIGTSIGLLFGEIWLLYVLPLIFWKTGR